MHKIISIFCFIFLLPCVPEAQVLPKEGSVLNYRIIGFKFPVQGVGKYTLEIASGTYISEDSFKKNIIARHATTSNKMIAEVPAFGKDYTWRVVRAGADKRVVKCELYHFSTLAYTGVDTTQNRLRIITAATKYKDAYVFIEANRALYNMAGQPVWFLPKIDNINPQYIMPFDLQLSPQGTITFLYEGLAGYELNYNGEILFKTPKEGSVNGDTTEYLHHEFRRLKNGHYMALGTEIGSHDRSFAAKNDSSALYFPLDHKKLDSNGAYEQTAFGTVIEYDHSGKIVWSWRSAPYFKQSDIFNHIGKGNRIDINMMENSFYLDEKEQVMYVGFREISRILKIKYPEGRVLNAYGEVFKPGVAEQGNGLFCRQHSCKLSAAGNLYLFNNHSCDFTSFPSVLMVKPTVGTGVGLKKVWEYICPIEGQTGKTQTQYQFTYGGNVVELPDHAIFTSMSTLYSSVFIVSAEKKLLWSALPEHWNKDTKKWELVFQYKASLINSRKELEKLIWNQEGGER